MPYLRFLRDERGYEHTYVLHGMESGSRPSVLYWFRTPPNVSVGREPLDEEAIEALEDRNPDLTFDWARMTKTIRARPAPQPWEADRASRRRRPESSRKPGRPPESPTSPEATVLPDASPPAESQVSLPLDAEQLPLETAAEEDAEARDAVSEPAEHPVAALLGEDALIGLRVRYEELRGQLAESVLAPADRIALAARVESLDPDAWRPGEQTVTGIERFDREAAAIRVGMGG